MTCVEVGFSNDEIIAELEKVIAGGWLVVNLTERKVITSEHVMEVMQLPAQQLRFKDVVPLIYPDDRDRMYHELKTLYAYGKTNTNLRICSPHKPGHYKAVCIRFGEVTQKNGCKLAVGYIRRLDPEEDASYNWEILNNQFKDLKYWQDMMPRMLLMLLDSKKFNEMSVEILKSIISRFNADRAYLIEYNWHNHTRSCIHEQLREGVPSIQSQLQNIPTSRNEWWHSELTAGRMVAVNNREDLPPGELKERLTKHLINSAMFVPMMEQGKTWGYICVDISHSAHDWKTNEQSWFQTIGHIASIALALRRAYSDVFKEREHLKCLQRNMPAGFEVYDHNGYLIESNQTAIDLIGLIDLQNLRALNINIFDNTFIPQEKRDALRRGEKISCEIYYTETSFSKPFFKNTDRNPKNIILEATPVYNPEGNLMNYLTVLSDHTENMQTYSQLREFKKMFSLISEFSEVGFLRINLLDNKLDYEATDQWFHNFNVERMNINFASGLIPDTIDPDDAAAIGRFINESIHGNVPEFHRQVKVLNSDGTLRWLRVHIKVVDYQPNENQVILFGLSIDVTQLKDVELKLIEAKTKAEQSDLLKSAFLANMNHEIRTPLNAIVGFSNMIAEAPTSEMNKDLAVQVVQNNDLLLQIISDVLDLAEIEAGIFEAVLVTTPVNQMCDEIRTSFFRQKKNNIEFVFTPHLPDFHILCDRNRVVQVLNKFVSNALKFTNQGKIELGFAIIHEEYESFIEFFVTDTGIGMTPEQSQKCFDRFMKANSFIQGTGLGLSVCKELVAKLNGTIGVSSQVDIGSRFWFRLPYMPTNVPSYLIDELTVHLPNGRKPVILIAEDTVVNFLHISSLLQQYYTVIVVQNGQDAVRVHAEKAPDLILMDLKMPRMDGLEATRIIRRMDPHTPIVAITAFAFEYDKQAAIEAGCNFIMAKPVNQLQLRKMVKQLLESEQYEKRQV